MESAISTSWIVLSALFLIFIIWFFHNRKKDKRHEFCIIILIVFSLANPYYSTNSYLLVAKSILYLACLAVLTKLHFDLYRKIEGLSMKKG